MPKGKKFDAAEKHFQKKEIKLQRELQNARDIARQEQETAQKIQAENDALRQENEMLKSANTILAETSKLSEQDIALLLKRAQSEQDLVKLLQTFGRFSSFYP